MPNINYSFTLPSNKSFIFHGLKIRANGVKLIYALPDDEKNIVLKVIVLALSKKKFKEFFQQQLQ
jgi:hypothetical protein